jgi:hypothetical protein
MARYASGPIRYLSANRIKQFLKRHSWTPGFVDSFLNFRSKDSKVSGALITRIDDPSICHQRYTPLDHGAPSSARFIEESASKSTAEAA